MDPWILSPLVFGVATLYASVGHGGASGYLAVMALLAVPRELASTSALVLNVLVSASAWTAYRRAGHFHWRLVAPFLAGSLPAAFIGGRLTVSTSAYNLLLGGALAAAATRLMWSPASMAKHVRPPALGLSVMMGVGIGFLSGALGIGGGVFLSPLLLFMGWAEPKNTAAASAFFILANSLAGLAGRGTALEAVFSLTWTGPIAAAVLGALWGGRWGAFQSSRPVLARVLGGVLAGAGAKLVLGAFR